MTKMANKDLAQLLYQLLLAKAQEFASAALS